jgi:hypothetical protein
LYSFDDVFISGASRAITCDVRVWCHGASCIFYTDGSLIEGCAGFVVHQMGVGGFGHKILSPAGVFTGEVIQPPERCLILTDSLSSISVV